jgi:phenylpyruvate tautomerase PptA (4-oxalocrotonate tautomerase family)
MTQLVKVVRRQLQLPLENVMVHPHPVQQARRDLIEALADLLLEALGAESTETTQEMEVDDERESHA